MVQTNATAVTEILSQLGLAHHAENFILQGITSAEDLRLLSDQNVEELGMGKKGERSRLREWISRANCSFSSSSNGQRAEKESNATLSDETLEEQRSNENEPQEHGECTTTTIIGKVKSVLNEQGWTFQLMSDQNVIICGAAGQNSNYRVIFGANEDKKTLVVYYISSIKVPEKLRLQAAEFITRANYGLTIGNFEMDFNDGEVRYKSSVDVEGGDLAPRMVHNLIAASGSTMDRYFPGLMGVCYGGKEACQAVKQIEEPQVENSQ